VLRCPQQICKKKCKSPHGLYRHIKNKHGGVPATYKQYQQQEAANNPQVDEDEAGGNYSSSDDEKKVTLPSIRSSYTTIHIWISWL
jgi:hypothetical protein